MLAQPASTKAYDDRTAPAGTGEDLVLSVLKSPVNHIEDAADVYHQDVCVDTREDR